MPVYELVPIDRLNGSTKRGMVFLRCEEESDLNAIAAFAELSGDRTRRNRERDLRARFDYWIAGGRNDIWFHGWPNVRKYKPCFVFKWKENRACHRFYGFLCHPTPNKNPAFQLCVLCSHAVKTEWETDPSELDGALALSGDVDVLAAIKMTYLDKEKTQWSN